ncbi:cysteine-rich receptor-like protein kinase 29 [Triticum dicoccoides]|uniref:cysteine-rich receptor-like protein kinase 29 n=1 Tax=Triticum dicoccoides TaxID=85692 RepID=UPI001890D3B5|nr:cysteine-rich receptor-like protein kinase 29 [Triticum dicoccoides]
MDDASLEPTAELPLDLLREITDGFSEERKLGSGTYGEVYLGVHQDGQKIAVKRIYDMPGVDDKQFQNELKNLTRLRHRNIVRLVGYCHHIQEVPAIYEGKLVLAEKIHRALCLEYMSNGSLENYISDECDKYDWHTGYGMIKGICHGLKYLHTELKPPIYHLDLKPANILLDENMVPRIADFGISRLIGDERTRATKSTLGTQGYLPPEYILYNYISSKFDIFSLGVVIIKIMSGRSGYYKIADMSPQEFTNLVHENWTNRLHEASNLMKAHSEQVKICIQIGLRCVNSDRHKRPSIQDIVNRLNETETECTYAARKDRSLIYEVISPSTTTLATDRLTRLGVRMEDTTAMPATELDGLLAMAGVRMEDTTAMPAMELDGLLAMAGVRMEDTTAMPATELDGLLAMAREPEARVDGDQGTPGANRELYAELAGPVDYAVRLAGSSPRGGKAGRRARVNDRLKRGRKVAAVRKQVRVAPIPDLGPPDDGYSWRKYGQKDILGAAYPRAYFRCTHRDTQGCQATKQVQRADAGPLLFEIVYHGLHTCARATMLLAGTDQQRPASFGQEQQNSPAAAPEGI